MEINEIKKRLPILTVLSKYGLKPDKNNHIRCPFHDDDKPSCKIYPETGTYHCFGCGKTGDQIQWIQDKEKCSQHEAILKAQSLLNEVKSRTAGIPGTAETEPQQPAKPTNTEKPWAELLPLFQNTIGRSDKAKMYCTGRGLDWEALQIGYNSGTYYKKIRECIVFPLKDKNGNVVSLYGRRITEITPGYKQNYPLEYGKHYYSGDRSGLYPCYPNPETEVLILTEAIIDAATLLQIPEITDQYTILSCYGNLAFTKEMQESVKNLPKLQEIIIFFDGDQGGLDGIKHVSEILNQIKPNVKVTAVATPEKEDVNSLYVKYDKDCLSQLINERKPVHETEFSRPSVGDVPFSSFENLLPEETPDIPTLRKILSEVEKEYFEKRSGLDTANPHKIIYQTETARYTVKGGLPRQLDKMLISLDVQHLEPPDSYRGKYRCRLDLYEEKQTRKEAREAAEKLDLRADLIETDLSKLCDLLEEHRETTLNETVSGQADPMPDLPTQSKCKAFLSKENLIQNLNDLIGNSGIVGEENNRLFLFVIATSHKMPETLHALIQGSSGSGKTHLLSKIAALMPPERVVKFTRVTENSFYNYDEFFFRNKLICLEDIDGLKEEALFAWRELISNNQLSSSTSQKDENGNIRSAQRIVRGPMASICATTHGAIYEDNMSRLFIIAVDESSEQTTRIMNYQKQKAAGLIDAEKEKEATAFLQNIVRMLKPCKVVNPFAYQIHLPEKAHKIRRLNELYLAFVKQVTIINQYQRRRVATDNNTIITDIEDLRIANEIMFDSIFLKVDELDGSLRQFYEELKNHIKTKSNPEQYEFMQREIRHALNISKSQLQRYLSDLIELEYIQQMGGYQNRGYKYKILWWDDIAKLREDVKQYLKNQIDKLENNNQE